MPASIHPPALDPLLPRVDLHRHLEGAVRLQTVLDVARQRGLPLPAESAAELASQVTLTSAVRDILLILPKFDLLRSVFVTLADVQRVTRECLEDAAAEGLHHCELRFSPLFMAEPHNLDPFAITAAVCEAWQAFDRAHPMRSALIVILSRTYGAARCEVELACALRFAAEGVVGIDLAGDEARHPAAQFASHFRRAQDAGLFRTAHAGEFAGSASVWETIRALNPNRLGHAVRAADDSRLLEEIGRRGIAIECCPTSNLLTGAVASLPEHPLPRFLRAGIRATLNTDDPSLMGGLSLETEYRLAREQIGIRAEEAALIQRNGLEAAFLPNATQTRIREQCPPPP